MFGSVKDLLDSEAVIGSYFRVGGSIVTGGAAELVLSCPETMAEKKCEATWPEGGEKKYIEIR
jgi:hypothetical protein